MVFTLTKEWALEQFALGSALSGIEFSNKPGPFAPSIDRIDSSGGYTSENCRMILFAENMFKNQWDDEVVIRIAKAIAERASADE